MGISKAMNEVLEHYLDIVLIPSKDHWGNDEFIVMGVGKNAIPRICNWKYERIRLGVIDPKIDKFYDDVPF